MLTNTENHGELIEQLRKARNISRDELCEDVMSKRNYQRFSKGEVNISAEKIMLLIDRLGLDYFMYRTTYKSSVQTNDSILNSAFDKVVNYEIKSAELLLTKLDKNELSSKINLQKHEYIVALIAHYNNQINDEEFFDEVQKVINYPDVLKVKILNKVEINALISLIPVTCKSGDDSIVKYFISILENTDTNIRSRLSHDDKSIIIAAIARGFYILSSYEECIKYCDDGINNDRRSEYYRSIANLYAFKIFSLSKLSKQEQAINECRALYHLLMFEDNSTKIEIFDGTFNKILGYKITSLFKTEKEA